MQSNEDFPLATLGTLLLHAAVFVALLVAGWIPPAHDWRAPGPPVEASIQFTAADLKAAQAAAAAAPPPPPPAETQPKPQAPIEDPDEQDQEEVVEVGPLPSEETQVQEEQVRQEQVDLTEEIERQREAENREREREREQVRRELEEQRRIVRMEEQRLAQLADRTPAPPKPAPPAPPVRESGRGGTDAGNEARWLAAVNATARNNWNTGLAPELTRCRVRLQMIPGGEVINVEFMDCPYDAQGRESVERALRKTPMPYSGFESVFESKITVTFCYPEEACQ
jgi:colicin import membrane protein